MENDAKEFGIVQVLKGIWLERVPAYANRFFYSLGFLSMTSLFMLLITGVILAFFGPNWWFTTNVGTYIRSIHLWSAQAFVVFVILHLLIVFFSGGYRRPRQLTWVLGAIMFFLALFEAEFGYVLRNDFSSQWRSLQGADLYNGSGLGVFINNLNYAQIYGVHVIVFPFFIFALLFLHYALVRIRGIAKPYRKEVKTSVVKANHTVLFLRGVILIFVILILALVFPSPLIAPVTIQQIATDDPSLMGTTLLSEINHTSDTATYLDTIDPYQFNTMHVYVTVPYQENVIEHPDVVNMLTYFIHERPEQQQINIQEAKRYFMQNGKLLTLPNTQNPLIPIISSLTLMGQSGLYEAALRAESGNTGNPTYALRFLSDTGVMDDKANSLGITTEQYGMLHEEKGLTPGAWWLYPLGVMDNTFLQNDPNQDRDGAEILGMLMLLVIAFPYIPLVNRLPDKLKLYTFIWKDKTSTH